MVYNVSMFHHPIFSAEINYLVNSVNYPKLCRKLQPVVAREYRVGREGGC